MLSEGNWGKMTEWSGGGGEEGNLKDGEAQKER